MLVDDLCGDEFDGDIAQAMLDMYRPLVLLDSHEQHFPCSLEFFIANSFLECETCKSVTVCTASSTDSIMLPFNLPCTNETYVLFTVLTPEGHNISKENRTKRVVLEVGQVTLDKLLTAEV